MDHDLKIDAKYWPAVCDGRKTFEIRFNDRDFQTGDTITLKPVDFRAPPMTPSEQRAQPTRCFRITYVATFPDGLKDNYVVLGIVPHVAIDKPVNKP